MPALDDEAAELYGLPLEEFTSARNELAKRRRGQGDRDAAEAVKSLAKPTVAAWAVNQLARRNADDVEELLEAGEELRATHEALLSGDRDADVAAAARREREAVARLVGRARGLELSEAVLEKVGETLHAAAGSDELREQLRRGVVEREQQAAMFGGLAGAAAPAATPPRRRQSKPKGDGGAAERKRAERERAERERAEREERERREQLQAARAELRRLRGEQGRARRAAEAAERRLARAREELESREEETRAARSRSDEAERALAETERLIERLEG